MTIDEDFEHFRKMMQAAPDGSLPEFTVRFSSGSHRRSAVRYLLEIAGTLGLNEGFANVAAGDHILLPSINGITNLGLGVFESCLTLDFRTGESWSDKTLLELVNLLKTLRDRFGATEITLDDEEEFFSKSERETFNNLMRKKML